MASSSNNVGREKIRVSLKEREKQRFTSIICPWEPLIWVSLHLTGSHSICVFFKMWKSRQRQYLIQTELIRASLFPQKSIHIVGLLNPMWAISCFNCNDGSVVLSWAWLMTARIPTWAEPGDETHIFFGTFLPMHGGQLGENGSRKVRFDDDDEGKLRSSAMLGPLSIHNTLPDPLSCGFAILRCSWSSSWGTLDGLPGCWVSCWLSHWLWMLANQPINHHCKWIPS